MPEHTPAPTPHRAVYGFSFYLFFFSLFILYILWALLPTEQLGLNYLPDKYFAVYLPMLVLVGIGFFAFFIYPAINLSMTPNVDDMASVVDVSLVRRGGNENGGVIEPRSWNELKSDEPAAYKNAAQNSETFVDYCNICNENHQPTALKPIASLRFMDLQQVNRQLLGLDNV